MYPLRFDPIFQRYIWGGQRLHSLLNKQIGNEDCAESWEIVDHGNYQSVVKYGSLAGQSLHSLVETKGRQLLGESWIDKVDDETIPENLRGRFPLMLKFLDATKNLSVQVHPDDAMGAKLDPPDLGKTEAWYVMHADAGSKIYAGLKEGTSRADLNQAIQRGETEELLNSFTPKAGDCVLIRSGTLHAIGAGLVIAEIQQASNTTFRVFDWNRVDADGNSRELHIEQSLEATNFELGPVFPVAPEQTQDDRAKSVVSCDRFVMRKWTTDEPVTFQDSRLRLLAVTSGEAHVSDDPSGLALRLGETMMLPACCSDVTVLPNGAVEFLEIELPS